MPKELVYTSAIKGLKQGTRGFCTVAASPGINPILFTLLESLSGYRHLYPPNTPEAAGNPVIFSHLTIPNPSGAGSHLISRIADAGLDYSGRTNKIAHHLVLSDDEIARTDPAILFSSSNIFYTNWNSEPRLLNDVRPLSNKVCPTVRCDCWAKTTGDAGYAAVLAGSVLAGRPVSIIYRRNNNILALLLEASRLLPQASRWCATFSTFTAKYAPGIRCLWKAALAGTPEELFVRAIPESIVIDLADPVPLDSILRNDSADFLIPARTGQPFVEAAPEKKKIFVRVPTIAKTPVTNNENTIATEEFVLNPKTAGTGTAIPAFPENSKETQAIQLLDSIYSEMGKKKKKNRTGWIFLVFFLILSIVAVVAVAFLHFRSTENNSDTVHQLNQTKKENVPIEKNTLTKENDLLPNNKTDTIDKTEENSKNNKNKPTKENAPPPNSGIEGAFIYNNIPSFRKPSDQIRVLSRKPILPVRNKPLCRSCDIPCSTRFITNIIELDTIELVTDTTDFSYKTKASKAALQKNRHKKNRSEIS